MRALNPFLPHDTTPEERERGCVWASVFRSAADEVAKGGVISGTPVINHGAPLNGTTDYITYPLNGQLNLGTVSIQVEFWPDFAATDDVTRALCGDSSDDYAIIKQNNAASNVLDIYLGGTLIVSVPSATYASLWSVGVRNLLTVSGTTGATNAWLNGTQILTADATAWAATSTTTLVAGALNGGASKFEGKLARLHYFNALLTSGEHIEAWNGGV